jgi:hypothetical protein
MDTTVSFGLGVTSIATTVLFVLGLIVARGMKSRCVLGGNVVSVDIHKQTEAEKATDDNVQVTIPAPTPTVIEIHTQPDHPPIPLNTVRTPRAARDSTK